ncbi:hypothetical protein PTKU15_84840 [Paraburkholderia terrae]|nr:hypothetical protein PTKU15_84840 [Paraburkholderia terrae]
MPDWIGSHLRAFEFIGGCLEIVVPDFVPGDKMQRFFWLAVAAINVSTGRRESARDR